MYRQPFPRSSPSVEQGDNVTSRYFSTVVTDNGYLLPAGNWQFHCSVLPQTMAFKALYARADQFIDLSKFGASSWNDLYSEERRTTNAQIFDSIVARDREREGRSSGKGKKGVMYVSLDGGSSLVQSCPSLADSAAVSLSQMAFLSMTISIFSVVVNIANNLNNNNNNQD